MNPFLWIKRFLPRGLYGRAALILIVPVVTVQLVVSSVFLQRHFEDVTEQLTRALALDLRLLRQIEAEEGAQEAMRTGLALQIIVDEASAAQLDYGDRREFYDLSGVVVIEVMRAHLPGVQSVDLVESFRDVTVIVDAGDGLPVRAYTTSRGRVSASNPHQLLVIMVLTGILMTGIAVIFLRNQLRPIRRLARAADAFGKGRVVAYHPTGATEVRSAGRAFLDMRARIENQIEQRTLMLSGVSHDLRTPLTRMRLGLSMLEDGPEVADLTRDVEEMETLLNTFLEFARGDALDDPELSDPVALARRVVEDAQRGGGRIRIEAPEHCDPVEMRPQAVHRALSNLVSNALRYGNNALVSVTLLDRALRLTVEDDGPGIPAARRADALRPFFRLDEARNQDRGSGVGLGLAIANDIARRHGGTLRLGESARFGGLRVDLVLPR